jgi:hypothetical protein
MDDDTTSVIAALFGLAWGVPELGRTPDLQ